MARQAAPRGDVFGGAGVAGRQAELRAGREAVQAQAQFEDEIAAPGQIVISGSTYARVKDKVTVRPLGAKLVRGRTTPLETFAVES